VYVGLQLTPEAERALDEGEFENVDRESADPVGADDGDSADVAPADD
jgi:hypothetical protein